MAYRNSDVCSICGETSCPGPVEHQTSRRHIDTRIQARVVRELPPIDWRYIDFNLETETGKQGFQARVEGDIANYKDRYGIEFRAGSALLDYERQNVISSTQEAIAKSIIFDLLK